MRIVRTVAALSACTLGLALPASAEGRTEVRPYVASAVVTLAPNCALSGNVPLGENPDTGIGGACFPIEEGETAVAFSAHDDVGPYPVGGTAYFFGYGGEFMEPLVVFCGATRVEIPEGAAQLVVQPDLASPALCGPQAGSPGIAGRIEATFS